MKPSQTIFLEGDDTIINIDGVEMTIKELKNHLIDLVIYRKHAQKNKEESS